MDQTEPVGLWGELTIIALVLDVILRLNSSQSMLKPVDEFSGICTGMPPAKRTIGSYAS